jgi:hypothetical protein
MATQFPSARHQAALATPTGYRRWMEFTFTRGGDSVVLEPVSGTLTADATRNGRWDGRLSFVGDDLLPTRPGDILTPFGTRVTATLGIELLDGSVSTVPYGTYEITTAGTNTSADQRTVDVTLGDVSGLVDRYRFETSLTVASGTDLGAMINTVVANRTGFNPGVGVVGATLGAARVFGLDTGTAPWAEILDVLSGFSRTAWYDRTGAIQVGTVNPDPNAAYPISSLASLSADFDTRPPNVIVARGEPQDDTTPVQAVSMAYLTHVSGHAFAEYFARGQSWGDGGMQAALIRQFDLNSRAEFLQDFAKQALQHVSKRVFKGNEETAGKK